MKKLLIGLIIAAFLVASVGIVMAKPAGYNYKARVFVGTGYQWCEQKYGVTDPNACEAMLGGPYGNDKLVMKWNKAWDDARFHGGTWTCDAWTSNEWNGKFPGGSGEIYHVKIVYVGPELQNSPCWEDGGYALWTSFEAIMSHGTYAGQHSWYAHATPTGYGEN